MTLPADEYRRVADAISASFQRLGRVPDVAVLGPAGSGKTTFLLDIAAKGRALVGPRKIVTLYLDLRELTTDSDQAMTTRLLHAVWRKASDFGLVQNELDLRASESEARFDDILLGLLDTPANTVVLLFDHIDAVPRYFARLLARRIRSIRENQDLRFRSLAFVVAGTLSLFELKQEADSAFSNFDVVCFPLLRIPELSGGLLKLPKYAREQLILHLIEETGGEPTFVNAILAAISRTSSPVNVTRELIDAATSDIISSETLITALHDLALEVWHDKELFHFVEQLCNSKEIPSADPVIDIHRFQLAGVAVFNGQEVRFRNRLVERFLRHFLIHTGTIRYSVGQRRLLHEHSDEIKAFPLLLDLLQLSLTKTEFLSGQSIASVFDSLSRAWSVTTHHGVPELALNVRVSSTAKQWWIGSTDDHFLQPSQTSALRAVDSGERHQRSAFGTDSNNVSFAVTVGKEPLVQLVATLKRTDVHGSFSEAYLNHWAIFLKSIASAVNTFALSTVAKRLLLLTDGHLAAIPTHTSPTSNGRRRDRIYLMAGAGALASREDELRFAAGICDERELEDINNRCKGLLDTRDNVAFEETLRGVSMAVQKIVRGFDWLPSLLESSDHKHCIEVASGAPFLKLPIELLPVADSFLFLQRPIVRRIFGPRGKFHDLGTLSNLLSRLKAKDEAFSALIVTPGGREDLPLAWEEAVVLTALIEEACKRASVRCRISHLEGPEASISNLELAFGFPEPIHLFHYSGHSILKKYDPEQSGLVLMDTDGELEIASTRYLRRWFESSSTWLAYFSSCQSAAVSGSPVHMSRYWGIIDAVIGAGTTHIIAFRNMVSDHGADHFARRFYTKLLEMPDAEIAAALFQARVYCDSSAQGRDAAASAILVCQD